MQIKKYPEVDVGRNSSLYFAVGLNIMLFLTYYMLELKTYAKEDVEIEIVKMDPIIQEDIPIIKLDVTMPPPPPPAPEVTSIEDLEIVDDETAIAETIFESTETDQSEVVQEYQVVSERVGVDEITVEEVEDDIEVPFAIIENAPVFPGCEGLTEKEKRECFKSKILAHVHEHFNYPERALELGIRGRVHVYFFINQRGEVDRIKTRGPDKMLETEAERIISLIPKMVPGKQRGRPVKVPYSIPINFTLQQNE